MKIWQERNPCFSFFPYAFIIFAVLFRFGCGSSIPELFQTVSGRPTSTSRHLVRSIPKVRQISPQYGDNATINAAMFIPHDSTCSTEGLLRLSRFELVESCRESVLLGYDTREFVGTHHNNSTTTIESKVKVDLRQNAGPVNNITTKKIKKTSFKGVALMDNVLYVLTSSAMILSFNILHDFSFFSNQTRSYTVDPTLQDTVTWKHGSGLTFDEKRNVFYATDGTLENGVLTLESMTMAVKAVSPVCFHQDCVDDLNDLVYIHLLDVLFINRFNTYDVYIVEPPERGAKLLAILQLQELYDEAYQQQLKRLQLDSNGQQVKREYRIFGSTSTRSSPSSYLTVDRVPWVKSLEEENAESGLNGIAWHIDEPDQLVLTRRHSNKLFILSLQDLSSLLDLPQNKIWVGGNGVLDDRDHHLNLLPHLSNRTAGLDPTHDKRDGQLHPLLKANQANGILDSGNTTSATTSSDDDFEIPSHTSNGPQRLDPNNKHQNTHHGIPHTSFAETHVASGVIPTGTSQNATFSRTSNREQRLPNSQVPTPTNSREEVPVGEYGITVTDMEQRSQRKKEYIENKKKSQANQSHYNRDEPVGILVSTTSDVKLSDDLLPSGDGPAPLITIQGPNNAETIQWWFYSWLSSFFGVMYVLCWGASFYPQAYMNCRRRSVEGMSFDLIVYNIIGYSAYLTYTITQRAVQHQTAGPDAVEIHDAFFAGHSLLLCIFIGGQILLYDRGTQKLGKVCKVVCSLIIGLALVQCALAAAGSIRWVTDLSDPVTGLTPPNDHHRYLEGAKTNRQFWENWWTAFVDTWSLSMFFGYVKVFVTLLKYNPQVHLNFRNQSTEGMSILAFILDFSGGVLSLMQNYLDAYNYSDQAYIYGNLPKLGISFVTLFYDLLLMFQHFVLYKKRSPERLGSYSPVANAIGAVTLGSAKSVSEEELTDLDDDDAVSVIRRRLKAEASVDLGLSDTGTDEEEEAPTIVKTCNELTEVIGKPVGWVKHGDWEAGAVSTAHTSKPTSRERSPK